MASRLSLLIPDGVSGIVYVDSGSIDSSLEIARSLGVEIVSLDETKPFTAARGRNAGFRRLLEIAPDTRFVQFVDGDCELSKEWLVRAEQEISRDDRIGVNRTTDLAHR